VALWALESEVVGDIRDRDVVFIATLPPIFGDTVDTPYPDPAIGAKNLQIVEYNAAIQDPTSIGAAAWPAGVQLGPDFYSCFLTPTNNRFSVFADSLHPNGLGHAMMAALWEDVIRNGAGSAYYPPAATCPSPVYIVESLDPYAHGHKQNLLEVGDPYYNDASFTLTNVPAELADGVWITQSNADNGDFSADFLSFDAGASPVTVYIAYDSAGAPPTSSTHVFAAPPAPLSSNLTVSDPAVGTFALVQATNVTGTVTIGGTVSGGGVARTEAPGIMRSRRLTISVG